MPKAPDTRAESSHGAQYWPRNGTSCAGPSGENRRGHSRRCCEPDVQPRAEVDPQRLPVGAQRPGDDAQAVARDRGASTISVHTSPVEVARITIAQSGQTPAIASALQPGS